MNCIFVLVLVLLLLLEKNTEHAIHSNIINATNAKNRGGETNASGKNKRKAIENENENENEYEYEYEYEYESDHTSITIGRRTRAFPPNDRTQRNGMSGPWFLSFDGVDGGGKTTQIGKLADRLRSLGHQVVTCRDPGSTELGERIRDILLGSTDLAIGFRAEMLLYMSARAQLVEQVIRPALAAGQTVISDRFLLANVVYQGYAGGLDVPSLWQVGLTATGGLLPDLTFVLDIDPRRGAARRRGKADRLEQRSEEYFDQVRAGFRTEAQRDPISLCSDRRRPRRGSSGRCH